MAVHALSSVLSSPLPLLPLFSNRRFINSPYTRSATSYQLFDCHGNGSSILAPYLTRRFLRSQVFSRRQDSASADERSDGQLEGRMDNWKHGWMRSVFTRCRIDGWNYRTSRQWIVKKAIVGFPNCTYIFDRA